MNRVRQLSKRLRLAVASASPVWPLRDDILEAADLIERQDKLLQKLGANRLLSRDALVRIINENSAGALEDTIIAVLEFLREVDQ